ncbi:MAG TPA: hypothetical protein VFS43_07735, partial [Polyangiaceae bacterium]|nr:hypothetical protein [Polyangiaceae bacterium]
MYLPRKTSPLLLCALPLAAYAAGCGVTDVPFGAQPSGLGPVLPEGDGSPSPLDTSDCRFGGFGWRAHRFALYPDGQDCSGQQWVRHDEGLGLWVGLTACEGGEARVYLAASPEGPFAAAADWAGHGQDHCELVNAAFTLTDEDDITSGGCADCSTGPNLPLEGLPAYARGYLGEPFAF